ncbi:MAG TPA: glycosyl transferase, partial [Cytophagales bacterium]|nr:glycosyl transferase [Cytophagales bacterium]
MKKNFDIIYVFIAVAGISLFVPFLGSAHLFDWDEVNFAECAREMLITKDYSRVYIDFQPFWEKPPMFFWLQSTAMRVFGVNEFAARFPNALCGVATLLILYAIGKKLFHQKFGILWTLAYAGSFFPNMYFKSGIIDPWFNLFIFLSLYFFILYSWKRNHFEKPSLGQGLFYYAALSGVFMGLAILMKGQVAFVLFCLSLGVYFLYNRFKLFFSVVHVFWYLLVTFLVTLTWYGYETAKNGTWFIAEFIQYQYRLFSTHDAGQEGFPGYHYVVILLGCFPASVLALPSFFRKTQEKPPEKDFRIWMIILFWVVTVLFSVVKSRIIHYSSLAWFPVTFLAAYTVYNLIEGRNDWKRYVGIMVGFLGYLIALLLAVFPFVALNIKKIIPYVEDVFAQANMEADVPWTGFESLIGIAFAVFVFWGLKWFKNGKPYQAAFALFGGTGLTIFLASAGIVTQIKGYSQQPVIEI